MSRAALRQLVWLGVLGLTAFLALMAALAWASSRTGGRPDTFGAIDFEHNAISVAIRQEPLEM